MSVVFWCDSFGDKIDEIFYIFREKAPNTTLILSLTLRMMPKFSDDFRFISISQRCSGNVCEDSGWIKKIKYFLDIFFIFLCFEFKNLNESALSLESREYSPGILPRIAGEKKKFASIPEVAFKIAMFTLAVVIILLNGCGFEGLSVLLYAVFCAVPLIICLLEVLMCRSFL
jgi:energy-coupling factor transport system permease protein